MGVCAVCVGGGQRVVYMCVMGRVCTRVSVCVHAQVQYVCRMRVSGYDGGVYSVCARTCIRGRVLGRFECNGHIGHVLTQWCLLPPRTCIVKSSLFMHMHSSPRSLAAR